MFEVVAAASPEVRSGILYATAIIILVYVPLFAPSTDRIARTGKGRELFGKLGIGVREANMGQADALEKMRTGEVAATIYHGLGISLEQELPGAQGRPIPIVDRGIEPIRELIS